MNYVLCKQDKQDLNDEIENLRIIYITMNMKLKLIKQKTILFKNEIVSRMQYFINTKIYQILALYCIYKIFMTCKNLLFQDYNDINIMLKDRLSNAIDFSLKIILRILNLEVNIINYTIIEQYFSLFILGIIIVTNIRSFLLSILFIYTKIIKKYSSVMSKNIQLLFLSYFVGLFYVNSSIFMIFNLPITYR